MFFTVISFDPAFSGRPTGNFWKIHNITIPVSGSFLHLTELQLIDPAGLNLTARGINADNSSWHFDVSGTGGVRRGRGWNNFPPGSNNSYILNDESTTSGASFHGLASVPTLDFIWSFADAGLGDGPIGAVAVGGVKQAPTDAGNNAETRYIASFDLSYSIAGAWSDSSPHVTGASWTLYASVSGISFPGYETLSSLYPVP